MFFFSSLKLQYCRTIILLNKLELKIFKETSFSKATMVMRFPAKKNVVAQKHCTISRLETPGRVVLGLLSPSPGVCTDGRTYADVTTKVFRIDRLPNLLTNGAPLAGFARRLRYQCKNDLKTCSKGKTKPRFIGVKWFSCGERMGGK